ncbi:hypothetical protein [Streptomyces sp. NRRL F-5650]|uniref:hypothetical protein n=1 Tax=Streptomyces sp. NRRL F-5650 TaxID=1463868 RepID=UPI0004CA344F|nr:hypothetical protein [Streptomyces sp. NRRL F-5650]
MRVRRAGGVPCAVSVALAGAVLAGCRGLPGPGHGGTDTAGVRPSGYGAVFLAAGECSSSGPAGVGEVPCGSERAVARVVAREDGRASDGPPCPGTTDFVLHLSEHRPSADEDGDGIVPRGYACMRRLRPPHPGDPGAGGGPRTVVGDCVRDVGGGRVREVACAAPGGRGRGFQVVEAVAVRADCPASTVLYVRLGGDRPVGCARPR